MDWRTEREVRKTMRMMQAQMRLNRAPLYSCLLLFYVPVILFLLFGLISYFFGGKP